MFTAYLLWCDGFLRDYILRMLNKHTQIIVQETENNPFSTSKH